jgi:hypothetical protein
VTAHKNGDEVTASVVSGPQRAKTSIYLDPLIFRSFRDSCSKVGQSTCGVLEPFMYAFTKAVGSGDYHDPRPLTVNLTVNRIVQRVRRRGLERIYEEEPGPLGTPYKCFGCGRDSVYKCRLTRIDPMRDAYACAGCYTFLRDRGGIITLEVKTFTGEWLDPTLVDY